MKWKSFERELDHGPVRATVVVWRWALFALFLVGVTCAGIWVVAKPFAIVADTLDGDNVKQNYEWFKQRHEDVLAIDRKIQHSERDVKLFKTEAGPRKDWKREDRIEASRLQSISTGLQQQRDDLVADYNARSRMVNRAIFKGNDTPARIARIAGEVTHGQ